MALVRENVVARVEGTEGRWEGSGLRCNLHRTLRSQIGRNWEDIWGKGDSTSKARWEGFPVHTGVACAAGRQDTWFGGRGKRRRENIRERQESDWRP